MNVSTENEWTYHNDAVESRPNSNDTISKLDIDTNEGDSYEELEQEWLVALNIDDLPSDYMMEDGSEDEEEFILDGNKYDDDYKDDANKSEVPLDDVMIKELNFDLALSEVMDVYSIEKNIFTDVEFDDIKTKERILIERGIKGYYRSKKYMVRHII